MKRRIRNIFVLLFIISISLNIFQSLDYDESQTEEDDEKPFIVKITFKNERDTNQFLESVPKAFERQNIDVAIVSGTKHGKEKEIPTPDFFLSRFNITFTIGQTYEEKCNGFWGEAVIFQKCNTKADMVCYCTITEGIQQLDIAIVNKTEEEWFETIQEALEEVKSQYLPRTWNYLQSINEECNGGH